MLINYTRRYRDGEPGDDSMKPESPRLLSRCFETLISERVRTKEQILADVSLRATDIEALASLPRGFFSGHIGEVIELPLLRKKRAENADTSKTAEVISLTTKVAS